MSGFYTYWKCDIWLVALAGYSIEAMSRFLTIMDIFRDRQMRGKCKANAPLILFDNQFIVDAFLHSVLKQKGKWLVA